MERVNEHERQAEQTETGPELTIEKQYASPEVDERDEDSLRAEKLAAARSEARHEAKAGSEVQGSAAEKSNAPVAHRGTQKKVLYRQTMRDIRSQLSGPRRQFSRLIHARPVEVAAETLSRTALRPLPLLSAGLFAFCFSTVVFVIGHYYGYELVGGGWWVISLAAGYALGMLIDLLRLVLHRRRA